MHHTNGPRLFFNALWFRPMLLLPAVCLLLLSSTATHTKASAILRTLQSDNHFALIRHAIAPGIGDPEHFTLGDCSTQRNLSDAGREQAIKIGKRFQAHGITTARVFSSQWCRCLETAQLLGLGRVKELPQLNSFFRHFERKESQTQALSGWLARQEFTGPLVLVTHQVNITALTGIYPASGEIIIVHHSSPGTYTVVGRVKLH